MDRDLLSLKSLLILCVITKNFGENTELSYQLAQIWTEGQRESEAEKLSEAKHQKLESDSITRSHAVGKYRHRGLGSSQSLVWLSRLYDPWTGLEASQWQ